MKNPIPMFLLTLVVHAGCSGEVTPDPAIPNNAGQAIDIYSQIVSASYQDTLTAATEFSSDVDAFLRDPSATSLATAQAAWRAAREPYLQTEVYRFYDGPIDNPTDGPEGMLNAWPMDEAFVDYVAGDADAGMINDATLALTEAAGWRIGDVLHRAVGRLLPSRPDLVSDAREHPFPTLGRGVDLLPRGRSGSSPASRAGPLPGRHPHPVPTDARVVIGSR